MGLSMDDMLAAPTAPTAPTGAGPSAKTADSWHSEGVALYRRGALHEALRCYDQALSLRPDFAVALNSQGFVLQDLGRLDEALAAFGRAVSLAPQMAMARLNLAMAQLKTGDFERGWLHYEARWAGAAEAQAGTLKRPDIPLPQWTGEGGTEGQRLLVVTEQGFGDTFQFARYLPMAAARFAQVGFAVSPPTQRLIEWSFGDRIPTFTRLPTSEEGWRDWDVHCPLMSLPRAFGTRLDTIPADVPYLRVPAAVSAHWRGRMDRVARGRLRVGIAWAGRKEHRSDGRRSLGFEQIKPLLGDPRVCWFPLHKRMPGDEVPDVPTGVHWVDWTEEGSSDFADAAAWISHLDLVITIDSVMAHLAGGLGRPVWLLDRFDNEWRWLTGREDSPWYPSLRIFRQRTFGEWSGVIDRVAQALKDLPSPRAISAPPPIEAASTGGSVSPPDGLARHWQQAVALHQAGRLREAEAALRALLRQAPQRENTQQLLGVVLFQQGRLDEAIACIEQAVALRPDVALFHSNLGEMCRQRGRVDEAIVHGERAVSLDPSMASAWSNLGIAFGDAGQPERAKACQEEALQRDPRLLPALNHLGSLAREAKDLRAAMAWYRQALAVKPDYVETLSNLGAVLVEDEQHDAAQAPLEQALRLHPDYPEALCNLGLVRLKQGRSEDAIALLQRSLQRRPRYPEAMVGLALGLHELDRLPQARHLLEEVLTVRPERADVWCHLGTIRQELGDIEAAEAAYRRALSLDAASADALTGLGNIRLEQGHLAEAETLLRQAIDADPSHLGARFHLVQARKIEPGDELVASLEARLPDEATLSPDKRVALHYALGKVYDDLREWDKAFARFLDGARLQRSRMRYDEAAEEQAIQAIMDTVDAGFIHRHMGQGDPSAWPVFVLGMPRSGTTLTEQIIASHPQAHGAGELPDLLQVLQAPAGSDGSRQDMKLPLSMQLREATPERLRAWGGAYATRLRQRAPAALRITDKLPGNYVALGIIPLILPNARIIHVQRHPVDTCLSCFTRLFNRHQEPTYDLAELGRHYVRYARLMAHWRRVLPAGSVIDVRYEDIVADMPTQARRLIEAVGLPWDDACLAFHENTRRIRTASVAQVRQPIYNSSVARWRHYERYLQPLLDELGDLACP